MKTLILILTFIASSKSIAQHQNCVQACDNPNNPYCTNTGSKAFRAYVPFAEMLATIPDSGFVTSVKSSCNRTTLVTGNVLKNIGTDCNILLNDVPVFSVQMQMTGSYEGILSEDVTPKGLKVKRVVFSNSNLPASLITSHETGDVDLSYGTAITEISYNESGMILYTNNNENCFFVDQKYLKP